MFKLNESPHEQLNKLGRRLHFMLNDSGIEAVPDDIVDALLLQSGGYLLSAITRGRQFVCLRRPIVELCIDLSLMLDE